MAATEDGLDIDNEGTPAPAPLATEESEYFDLNALKGAVSLNTKPFKHRALMWVGLWKVLLFPFCPSWWLTRISRWRFFVGCTLYVLHNACAWLYICRYLARRGTISVSSGCAGTSSLMTTQLEILLPYIIGSLFGVGYGSVVASAGWEALRVPSQAVGAETANSGEGRLVGTHGSCGERMDVDELESSASGSDNEETEDESTGARGDVVIHYCLGSSVDEPVGVLASNDARDGKEETKSNGDALKGSACGRENGGHEPMRPTDGPSLSPPPMTLRNGSLVGHPGMKSDADTLAQASDGSGCRSNYLDDLAGQRRIPLLQQPSNYDLHVTDVEEEEDEEEDCGGWGQVVVKPVKVAQWDKEGRQWKKKFLSLPELRQLILERAEGTTQNFTYQRVSRVSVLVTTLLPTIFAVYTILAAAWAGSGGVTNGDHAVAVFVDECNEQATGHARGGCVPRIIESWCQARGAVAGSNELEEWALWAMARAFGAMGALIERVLQQANMDAVEVVTTIVSMSAVAFITCPTYFALAEAERTYQRRYMYSKYFCALTSSQRARKYHLPHFSLKNVANIRVWLALRAGKTWLRRYRRERRADAVVSMAFFFCIALIAAIIAEVVSREARFLSTLVHWELLVWCCFISFFLLRYLTLGSNTNNRYRDTSVLLTEQINVQLRILQNSTRAGESKASKRERLVVSSNVLKLATKLLKELDGPNKLSGLSMNPVLYNVTRVVLVSALSGVMSDTLGFNIKLWKILSFK